MNAWHNARYGIRVLAAGTWVLATLFWAKIWAAGKADEDMIGPVVLVLVGVGMLYIALVSVPILASPLTIAWLAAAGTAGYRKVGPAKAPPSRPEKAVAEPETPAPASSPEEVYEATRAWIRERIGDRQGVHLRDLLEHAQQHGMFADLDVTSFRGHLERHGFPVKDRVRVRGLGVTVGIHLADLEPPSGPSPAALAQGAPESELHPL